MMRAVRVVESDHGRESDYGRRERIVIVGGGPAGWAAASELRRASFSGEVVVIADEALGPYDRTACSKGLINGHQLPRDIRLDLKGCADVTWRIGQRAVGLEPAARRVILSGGESYAYDGLVIATGSRPTLPSWWPSQPEENLYPLHDVADATALRQALAGARKVAVVGGGLTGCEVACTTVAQARKAVVINSQPYLMPRSIGEPIGALVTAAHHAAGIETRLGCRVAEAARFRGSWRLVLNNGDVVTADMVVLTAGERPDVDWLEGSGLDVSNGVRCDATLRALGADGVVAAGALVNWPNLRYGRELSRVGQWIAALEMGQGAARTLLAGRDAAPVPILPRFWSDQLGLRIQVCGRLDFPGEVGLTELRPGRKHTARAGVVASYSHNGRLTGVVAVNAPRAFTVASRMLAAEPVLTWFDHAAAAEAAPAVPAMSAAPAWAGQPAAEERPERRLRAVN
jgi:NADPH-dependent 2,4-dienoyl-CoA reductase/sulfur reductase-like enzyme